MIMKTGADTLEQRIDLLLSKVHRQLGNGLKEVESEDTTIGDC